MCVFSFQANSYPEVLKKPLLYDKSQKGYTEGLLSGANDNKLRSRGLSYQFISKKYKLNTMNKYLKYALLTLGIALVSGFVSWGVVRATLGNATSADDSSYSTLSQGNYPSSENDYGFLQSDYELTSSRTVGNAPDLSPAAELAVQAVVHIKVE